MADVPSPAEWKRPEVRPSAALLVASACILVTAFVVACGNDDPGGANSTGSTLPAPAGASETSSFPTIITAKDVAAAPPNSAERAVLNWFQAIQFKDVSAAAQLVDPPVLKRVGRHVFAAAVNTVGASLGRPSFVNTRHRGDQVALRVLVVGYDKDRKPAGSEAVTLYLRRTGKTWLVRNLEYLLRSSAAIAKAERRRR